VANVFVYRHGILRTPPATDGALEGITRDSVLEIASEEGLGVRVESLGRFDLFDADEVFLTGTGARIVPVATLDGQPIGEPGVHPLTDRLSLAFTDYTRQHGSPL
jgi:branched-chain amino acid aminotransferase